MAPVVSLFAMCLIAELIRMRSYHRYSSGSLVSILGIVASRARPHLAVHPPVSEEYVAPVPENERGDMVKAYHKLLNSEDDNVRYVASTGSRRIPTEAPAVPQSRSRQSLVEMGVSRIS